MSVEITVKLASKPGPPLARGQRRDRNKGYIESAQNEEARADSAQAERLKNGRDPAGYQGHKHGPRQIVAGYVRRADDHRS